MFSILVSASRAVLACTVLIEPSWPVFMACSMSSASAPRTSPTMMRSGRMRSALRTRSRWVTSPASFQVGGRVSSRTTCGCCSCSSAASSMVTTRSSSSIIGSARSAAWSCRNRCRRRSGCSAGTARRSAAAARPPGHGAICHHGVEVELLLGELADRDARAVEGERREDDVDAAAVGQARVADRAGFVDAAADRAPPSSARSWQRARCRGTAPATAAACRAPR